MRAGRREWLGLAVLTLPCLLYSMDLTVLYLAVPELSTDLHPTSVQLLWITDVYGFMLAGLLLPMGSLGDRIGRRRLLLIGAAAFGATSLLAAFAVSAPMLIVARALLGVAGATLAPSTLSLLHGMFGDPGQRTFAVGVWIASFSLGAAIGPLVGGALLQQFWWGSVFLIAVPVMVLLLVLGPRILPEHKSSTGRKPDLASAALSLIALLGTIYALKEAARGTFGAATALVLAAAVAAAGGFVRRQRLLPEPLIDLGLFRSRAFSSAVGAMVAAVFAVDGIFLFLAQYLQLIDGKSPLAAAAWLLPATGGLVLGAMLAPVATRRLPGTDVLVGGLAVAAAGLAVLTGIDHGLEILVLGSLLLGVGSGSVGTVATDIVIAAAPPDRAGAAAAISETGAELGGALGIALLGSLGLAVYRAQIGDALSPALTPGQHEAATNTLADAVRTSTELGSSAGGGLLHTAAAAFTDSVQAVAGTAALGTVLLAAFAAAALRRGRERRPEHISQT